MMLEAEDMTIVGQVIEGGPDSFVWAWRNVIGPQSDSYKIALS